MCKENCNCKGKDQVIELFKASNERKQAQINKLKKELENYKQLQREYLKLVEDTSFRCPRCSDKLVWDNDFDMEDLYATEGLVSFYHCENCNINVEVTESYE